MISCMEGGIRKQPWVPIAIYLLAIDKQTRGTETDSGLWKLGEWWTFQGEGNGSSHSEQLLPD